MEITSTNILQNENINIKLLIQKIDNLEKSNQEILSKLNSICLKTTNNFNEPLVTLGPRLQKINPENLTIIKVYESVAECIKEDTNIKRSSITKAVNENLIYMNYRWAFVDRELDPNKLYNIGETKFSKVQHLGYIAKVNNDKTEIINVYLDRKSACKYNEYESLAALDEPVKKCKLSKGFYYILYNDCDELLKKNFEKKYGVPVLYKDGIGQFDVNNILVKEFASKYQCWHTTYMSDKSLDKALNNNVIYNNFYYKHLNPILKML